MILAPSAVVRSGFSLPGKGGPLPDLVHFAYKTNEILRNSLIFRPPNQRSRFRHPGKGGPLPDLERFGDKTIEILRFP